MRLNIVNTFLVAAAMVSITAACSDNMDPGALESENVELENVDSDIVGGSTVTGAGPDQRWVGIVKVHTNCDSNHANCGMCTGSFITNRHILTAAHCFEAAGSQDVGYAAPGLAKKFVEAIVKRPSCYPGAPLSCDIALVELPSNEPWVMKPANTNAKFYLYGGSTQVGKRLHPYGYGYSDYEGNGAGTFRGGANRAELEIDSHTSGYFVALGGAVRMCEGDSGGPVTDERNDDAGFRPIIWGITSGPNSPGEGRPCAERDQEMRYTKTTTSLSWINTEVGGTCSNTGLADVQKCW